MWWRALGRPRRPDPVVFVIAALLCASTLVIFLHHRALGTLNRQTAALRIRATFDGPVFDTLASVNHPHLAAGRFDLVAQAYRQGLEAYPQMARSGFALQFYPIDDIRTRMAATALEQSDVQLTAGSSITLELKMQVAGLQEQVTVTGMAPLVERTSNSVGGSLSGEEID